MVVACDTQDDFEKLMIYEFNKGRTESAAQLKDILEIVKTEQNLNQFNRMSSCSTSSSCLDRYAHIFQHLQQVELCLKGKQKNEILANEKRLEGNQFFCKKEYKRAAFAYNVAILNSVPNKLYQHQEGKTKVEYSKSPKNVNIHALALANRSACLYQMNQFHDCIDDIHQAIAHGYPDSLKHKIYLRLGKCHLRLGQHNKTKLYLNIARKLFESQKTLLKDDAGEIMNCQDKQFGEDLHVAQSCLESQSKDQTGSNHTTDDGQQNSRADKKSSSVQRNKTCFDENHSKSNCCLEIKFDEAGEKGRFLAAKKEIHPGENILEEEALAFTLYPSKMGLNCHFCLQRLSVRVYPCHQCCSALFCSQRCEDSAYESFHKIECSIGDAISKIGFSQIFRLVIRIFTQGHNGHKLPLDLLQNKNKILSITDNFNVPSKVINKQKTSVDDDCSEISWLLNLMTLNRHHDVDAQSNSPESSHVFDRFVASCLIVKLLDEVNYFDSADDKCGSGSSNFNTVRLITAHVIFVISQVVQYNAHEIYEMTRKWRQSLKPFKNEVIALAIYSKKACYFNHSCNGQVARYFQGSTLKVKSLTSISVGEEVCDNYGPTFYLQEKRQRQTILRKRYKFQCQCEACENDWPLLKNMKPGLKVINKHLVDKMTKAEGMMNTGEIAKAFGIWKDLLRELDTNSTNTRSTSLESVRLRDKMRTCINHLGNLFYIEEKLHK